MEYALGKPEAIAWIRGEGRLRGCVKLYAIPRGTLVVAEVLGLPPGETDFFAMHIHEGGSCAGEGFPDTGGHYNPGKTEHPNHAGDLPPLLSQNGRAWMAVETNRFTPRQVIGRTVVIHRQLDDFCSQPSGNSGRKIGCGVIRCA